MVDPDCELLNSTYKNKEMVKVLKENSKSIYSTSTQSVYDVSSPFTTTAHLMARQPK